METVMNTEDYHTWSHLTEYLLSELIKIQLEDALWVCIAQAHSQRPKRAPPSKTCLCLCVFKVPAD